MSPKIQALSRNRSTSGRCEEILCSLSLSLGLRPPIPLPPLVVQRPFVSWSHPGTSQACLVMLGPPPGDADIF
ncbi:hypothetical protein Y1Q_0015939 [Alligator mississippiensis]|uniref:Uncharacterized protein n=1 Tax=Alligator mississippiensis TaxID=8496 RepID=A0A151MV58_ALLMI|nr:hypothetical protein Y1Q_0015939 [Alligator mississippiensis]